MLKKTCIYCGKEYNVKSDRYLSSKYCSRECMSIDKNYNTMTICDHCGIEYRINKSKLLKIKKHKFCSKKCQSDFYNDIGRVAIHNLSAKLKPAKQLNNNSKIKKESILHGIKADFENQNCSLLTNTYINTSQEYEFRCNIHCDKGIQTIKHHNYYAYKRDGWNFCEYCSSHVRKNMNYWDIHTINEYCINSNASYTVDEIKYVYRSNDKKKTLYALVKCPNENHSSYWVQWNNFLHGYRCPLCHFETSGNTKWNPDMAYDFFKEHGYFLVNKEDFSSVTKRNPAYIKDGFIVMVCVNTLKEMIKYQEINNVSGSGFSIFKNNPHVIYNLKLFCKLYRPDYEMLSDKYLGSDKVHRFKYIGDALDDDLHNREFECRMGGFLKGQKHPHLSKSSGEIVIEQYLINHNIKYVYEYKFKNLVGIGKRRLSYDFYLPEYSVLIEFQGAQHEACSEYFHQTYDIFLKQQEHDRRKREYAKSHSINLLEIWYWDFKNIDKILEDYLSSLHISEVS